jgi:hypothetical protein
MKKNRTTKNVRKEPGMSQLHLAVAGSWRRKPNAAINAKSLEVEPPTSIAVGAFWDTFIAVFI